MAAEHRIGLALGGGAARGWAHIGVLRALAERGITPDVVCGTSIGALVGGVYAAGALDAFEAWTREIRRRDILGLMDIDLTSGGLIEGERLLAFLRERFGEPPIEQLAVPYAAVATDLKRGDEVWLREGSLFDAVRASSALPGLFAPCRERHQWLVDGGLVNPVPVSVCRALGADRVIAVNLNERMIGKRFRDDAPRDDHERQRATEPGDVGRVLGEQISGWLERLRERAGGKEDGRPGLADVLITSIYIMQDRITRNRLDDDPPEVIVSPDLLDIDLMDFDQAEPIIEEGRAAVARAEPSLRGLLDA